MRFSQAEGFSYFYHKIANPVTEKLGYNAAMQSIQQIIEQKRAEVSKLLEEIEILEKAQALVGSPEPRKRRGGRPKGSKNKVTLAKRKSRKRAKKAGAKGTRGRGRKSAVVTEAPAES